MGTDRILADNMRRLRAAKGFSQETLAFECDLHRTYISGIERRVRNPTIGTLEKIAAALGVEVWQLLKNT